MTSTHPGRVRFSVISPPLLKTLFLIFICFQSVHALSQSDVDVTVHIVLKGPDGKLPSQASNSSLNSSLSSPVVVWLSPVGPGGQIDLSVKPGVGKSFQMVQKEKIFLPHLLVVPTGSVVAFPNRDPIFHNVFSLFNGRRFDLGLYETGNSHSVPFNREGVSYIFCNIHPEMGAVIVSVATPYYAVGNQASVQLSHVPPGEYVLKVWSEDGTPSSLSAASRRIHVDSINYDAGTTEIVLQPRSAHTNKFGQPYDPHTEGTPY